VKYFIQVCTDTATKALERVLENYSIFNIEARKIIVELKKKISLNNFITKKGLQPVKVTVFH